MKWLYDDSAGVIKQGVDGPHVLDHALQCPIGLIGIGEVSRLEKGLTASAFNFVDKRLTGFFLDIDNCNPGTFGSEHSCRRKTYARGTACDQNRLTLETISTVEVCRCDWMIQACISSVSYHFILV
jgi:hypothetical protein